MVVVVLRECIDVVFLCVRIRFINFSCDVICKIMWEL